MIERSISFVFVTELSPQGVLLVEGFHKSETHPNSEHFVWDVPTKRLQDTGDEWTSKETAAASLYDILKPEIDLDSLWNDHDVTKELIALGKRLHPDFDMGQKETMFWLMCGAWSTKLKHLFDTQSKKDNDRLFEWRTAERLVSHFEQCKMVFHTPLVFQIIKNIHNSRDINELVHKCNEQTKHTFPEQQTVLEFTPHIQFIPIPSSTIPPFTHTNLLLVESENEALIADPGASAEGTEQFVQILKKLPSALKVFITHHHRDHWEALPVVEKLHPKAVLIGHKNTLDRIETSLQKQALERDTEISVGNLRFNALVALGHTDGHMVLWDPLTRTLGAGDHVVGFGSAVLDATCGDMSQYFATTKNFISLQPHCVLPAHGPPRQSFAPISLLRMYIKHRQDREEAILSCIKSGARTVEDILTVVYKDVPSHLWSAAKSNIMLHLKKLQQDGKVPMSAKF